MYSTCIYSHTSQIAPCYTDLIAAGEVGGEGEGKGGGVYTRMNPVAVERRYVPFKMAAAE